MKIIYRAFAVIVLAVLMTVAISGCGEKCNHTYVKNTVKKASCCETGSDVFTCTECGGFYTESIPMLECSSERRIENEISQTCTTDGSYDVVFFCPTCNRERVRNTYTVPRSDDAHNVQNGECIYCNIPESSEGLEFSLNADGKTYTLVDVGEFIGGEIVIGIYDNKSVSAIANGSLITNENVTQLTVSRCVRSIDTDLLLFSNLVCYRVDPENKQYSSRDGVLYNQSGDTLLAYPCGKTDTAFTVPENVRSIKHGAFVYAKYLEFLDIPDWVSSLGMSLISYSSVEKIRIGKGIKTIEQGIFTISTQLKSIEIVGFYTEIGDFAFAFCKTLSSVTLGPGVIKIGNNSFDDLESLSNVTLSNGLQSIGQFAFFGCQSITELVIPETVNEIGSYAFLNCSSLKSLYISNGVKMIGRHAINGCTNLETLYIPKSVTALEKQSDKPMALLTVLCAHKTAPDGWDEEWCPPGATVIFDYNV